MTIQQTPTNIVLVSRPEGTTLSIFASIHILTIADGVSNAHIVGTNAPSIVMLIIETPSQSLSMRSTSTS